MSPIHEAKRHEIAETPLLLFECEISTGIIERWSTHAVDYGGLPYGAKVIRHNLFEMKAAADDGIDAFSRLTVTLANADSYFSQIARNPGWKGAKLTARFVFFDLTRGEAASESTVVFRGVCNPPDEITENSIRLTFNSRMNLQRILLPTTRIQRRCPWMFPAARAQREQAVSGGARGEYSPFYKCGYSPDVDGGVGSLDGTAPFTSCDYTRAQCTARGMFDKDASGRDTRRFGGVEFVPSSTLVKTYGEKISHESTAQDNEAKYNDFVPMVYGTGWCRPPVVFAKNDGNLTHMEVLLGMGEIDSVVKVVVNGNDLPLGSAAGKNATSTGWFNIVSHGGRQGSFNLDFQNANGTPMGDPYGSMAVLSVVVPNRISDGSPLPRVDVLVRGLKLATFDRTGEYLGHRFTSNPAWVLLDLLRRSGWEISEIDIPSFARSAEYCQEEIATTDLNGNDKSIPRFQCNLAIRRRRSAADIIRGVRNAAGLYLTYGIEGLLQLNPESSFAIQHAAKPSGSNAHEQLDGGWPAYEFGDGTNGKSDIVRQPAGGSSVRVWSRSTAETPNRYTIEFQDEFNEYQQDSLSLVDLDDAMQTGQELSASLLALGIPNFNQAGRILRLHLDKSIRGNTFVDFETGIRGIGLKTGDLITITYLKEGFDRQPFRIVRVAPTGNYRTSAITAQIHQDEWYTSGDGETGLLGGGRQPSSELGIPRPLAGSHIDDDGETQFQIVESADSNSDASDVSISVSFATPRGVSNGGPAVPLVSLAAQVAHEGGTLPGKSTFYYGVTAVDAEGLESGMSFIVRATISAGTSTNSVTLGGFSFSPETVGYRVYRGRTPVQMLQIAAETTVAASFVDDGKDVQPITPPDNNYHHANFYWRLELQPPAACTESGATSVGNSDLSLVPNEFRGKIVRLVEGKGRGQERIVISHDATTLQLSIPWDDEPDDTSSFVIAESGWHFAAMTQSSPVTFVIPNRTNAGVHVLGRSASVHDKECAAEISPLTRHTIGGSVDTDVPPIPFYALRGTGRGGIEISGIGFETFKNTKSITAGSLSLHFWDEIVAEAPMQLADDLVADGDIAQLSGASSATPGMLVQIGEEIVEVIASPSTDTYKIVRARAGTEAISHPSGSRLRHLQRRAFVLPFPRGYFGSPASGSYTYTLNQPNLRVVAAEMSVVNSRGTSQVGWAQFANTPDGGLRTLSGGQIVLQVDGPLAVQSNAVPPLTVDAPACVRDAIATIVDAPLGGAVTVDLTVDGEPWSSLHIEEGTTTSNVANGASLPPLLPGAKLGVNIVSIGATAPGAGLSVSVRL